VRAVDGSDLTFGGCQPVRYVELDPGRCHHLSMYSWLGFRTSIPNSQVIRQLSVLAILMPRSLLYTMCSEPKTCCDEDSCVGDRLSVSDRPACRRVETDRDTSAPRRMTCDAHRSSSRRLVGCSEPRDLIHCPAAPPPPNILFRL